MNNSSSPNVTQSRGFLDKESDSLPNAIPSANVSSSIGQQNGQPSINIESLGSPDPIAKTSLSVSNDNAPMQEESLKVDDITPLDKARGHSKVIPEPGTARFAEEKDPEAQEMKKRVDVPIYSETSQDYIKNFQQLVVKELDDFGVMTQGRADNPAELRLNPDFQDSERLVNEGLIPEEQKGEISVKRDKSEQYTIQTASEARNEPGINQRGSGMMTTMTTGKAGMFNLQSIVHSGKPIDERSEKLLSKEYGPQTQLSKDLPFMYAFEIETKLRRVIRKLLEPIIFINNETHTKLRDFKDYLDWSRRCQMEIEEKMENNDKLRTLQDQLKNKVQSRFTEFLQEIDNLRNIIGQIKQMQGVHETKIIQMNDERKNLENMRRQIRREIREFELLCRDISYANKKDIQHSYQETSAEMLKLREEMEDMKLENGQVKALINQQKSIIKQLQGKIGFQQQALSDLKAKTDDLPVLYNQSADTEHYIAKILPLQIQSQVYNTCKVVVEDEKDKRLRLMEHTDKILNDLTTRRDNKAYQLDKRSVSLPVLKQSIVDLKIELAGGSVQVYDEDENEDDDDAMSGYSDVDSPGKKSRKKFRFGPITLNQEQMSKLAVQVGKRQLKDEKYIEKLAEIIDGAESEEAGEVHEQLDEIEEEEHEDLHNYVQQEASESSDGGISEDQPKIEQSHQVPVISSHEGKSRQDAIFQQSSDSHNTYGDQDQQTPLPFRKQSEEEEQVEEPQPSKQISAEAPAPQPPQQAIRQVLKKNSGLSKTENVSNRPSILVKNDEPSEKSSPKKILSGEHDISFSLDKRDSGVVIMEQPPKMTKADRSPRASVDKKKKRKSEFPDRSPLTVEKRKMSSTQKSVKRVTIVQEKLDLDDSPSGSQKQSPTKKSPFRVNPSPLPSEQSKASPSGLSKKALSRGPTIGSLRYEQQQPSTTSQGGSSGRASPSKRRRTAVGKGASAEELTQVLIKLQNTDLRVEQLEKKFEKWTSYSQQDEDELLEEGEEIYDINTTPNSPRGINNNTSQSDIPIKVESEGKSLIQASSTSLPDQQDVQRRQQPSAIQHEFSFQQPSSVAKGATGSQASFTGTQLKNLQHQITECRKSLKMLRAKFFEAHQGHGFLSNHAKSIQEAVEKKISDFDAMDKKMKEKEEHLELLKIEQKNELKRMQRQNFTVTANFEKKSEKIDLILAQLEDFGKKTLLTDTSMATIFKLLRIQYALSHQDEVDRQDMLLFGIHDKGKEGAPESAQVSTLQTNKDLQEVDGTISSQGGAASTEKGKRVDNLKAAQRQLTGGVVNHAGHKILSVNKDCLMCSDKGRAHNQIPQLLKAFKMACLSYQPSPVVFENRRYDRNQLIEAQGYLLYLALRHMEHLDFDVVEKTLLGEALKEQSGSGGDQRMTQQSYNSTLGQTQMVDQSRYLERPEISIDQQQEPSAVEDSRLKPALDSALNPNFIVELSVSANDSLQDNSIQVFDKPSNQNSKLFAHNQSMAFQDSQSLLDLSLDKSSSIIDPVIHTASHKKMISFSKSKQYAKLANQVPSIFNIKNGQKTLSKNELVSLGIFQGLAPQDKYAKNIKHLKQYQRQLRRLDQEQRKLGSRDFGDLYQSSSDEGSTKRKVSKQQSQFRQQNNLTTTPEDLISQSNKYLQGESLLRNIESKKKINIEVSNALNQKQMVSQSNPLTPEMSLPSEAHHRLIARSRKKLPDAQMIDLFSPRKAEDILGRRHLPGVLSPNKRINQCLSSRPIQYNRNGQTAFESHGAIQRTQREERKAPLIIQKKGSSLSKNFIDLSKPSLAGTEKSSGNHSQVVLPSLHPDPNAQFTYLNNLETQSSKVREVNFSSKEDTRLNETTITLQNRHLSPTDI